MQLELKSAAILLCLTAAACGGGAGEPSPTASSPAPSSAPAAGQTVTVEIRDFEFSPRSISIQPGQTVRWVLRGADATHTTTERNQVWNSGPAFQQGGDSFEHTFTAEDDGKTFLYYCTSHQGCCQMQGSIRVGSSAPPQPDDY